MYNIKAQIQAIIETLPEEKLKEVLEQLQPLTADKTKFDSDFLFNTCQGMTLKMTGEQEITYYNKDGKWLFQQDYKRGKLYCSYPQIYQLLQLNYSSNYEEMNNFIQRWVETNLQWRGLIPRRDGKQYSQRVETNLQWRGLSPL